MASLALRVNTISRSVEQGLTQVPNSAQLELFCPLYDPT